MQDWKKVKDLERKGVPIKQIARTLGMSKNTVKKLMKLTEPPEYIRTMTTTKIDDYKDKIRVWYLNSEYDFKGSRILEELVKIGYEGTAGPVYRYLKLLNEEKVKISRRATVRYETPPGDQAQFDWSEYKVYVGDEKIKVYCFSMILSYSRKKAAVFSKTMNAVAVYEAIQDLFIELGGVTKELIIDNPKTLVIEHIREEEVQYNDAALQLFMYLQTTPNACMPYRARTKGKIEKPFQYIEEHFIKGSSFQCMDELNESIKQFMDNWNMKIHGTTGRIPNEAYEEEKDMLIKFTTKKLINVGIQDRIVSTDSFVSVGANRYSVPVRYVDKTVKVRVVYGYILEIYSYENKLIKTYRLIEGKKQKLASPGDYTEISSSVPKSIPEIKRVFESTFKNGEKFYALASKITNQPHYHAREFLKLKDLYEIKDLEIILEHCLQNNILRIDEMKSVIKDRYLELILEHETIELRERTRLTRPYDKQLEGITRSLSYYEKGGHI